MKFFQQFSKTIEPIMVSQLILFHKTKPFNSTNANLLEFPRKEPNKPILQPPISHQRIDRRFRLDQHQPSPEPLRQRNERLGPVLHQPCSQRLQRKVVIFFCFFFILFFNFSKLKIKNFFKETKTTSTGLNNGSSYSANSRLTSNSTTRPASLGIALKNRPHSTQRAFPQAELLTEHQRPLPLLHAAAHRRHLHQWAI